MTSINELLQEIVNGDLDAFENQIREAFKLRLKNRGALTLMQLKPGMRVKLVNCQKALQGINATIVATHKTMAVVDLDKPVGKWHKGMTCPPGLLQVIK